MVPVATAASRNEHEPAAMNAGSFQVLSAPDSDAASKADRAKSLLRSSVGFVAGLVMVGTIGFVGEYLAKRVPVQLSPLLYATAIGIAIGNSLRRVDQDMEMLKALAPAMAFAKQRLLRAGIVLYGTKLTFAKILSIGAAGFWTDLYVVLSSVVLGLTVGRLLGLSSALRTLISTGSAICGCSAVVATQGVVNAEAHEVATAVGVVVLCGTTAMFLYPLLFQVVPVLATDPHLMGIYTGATVHELAGVVAAGNAMGAEVASAAVVTKLLRVFMLAPWVVTVNYFGIGQQQDRDGSGAGMAPAERGSISKCQGVPWFAFGLIAVAAFNSIWPISQSLQSTCEMVSAGCLASAMAALGLDTDLVKVMSLGWRPVALAFVLWVNLLLGGGLVAKVLVSTL